MFSRLKKISSQVKSLSSVVEGSEAFAIKKLYENSSSDILYIASDGNTMEQIASVLRYILPDVNILTFPAWDTVPYDRISPNVNIVAERVNVLAYLAYNPTDKKNRIILTSIGSAIQKLPPKKVFLNSVKHIKVGGELSFTSFLHYASVNGYTRVEQVMEPGEYAVRGDILDIFPVGTDNPLRIDLFGDEVEKIRTFDVLTQRTTGEIDYYTFQAAGEVVLDENTVKNFRSNYRESFGVATKND